VEEHVGTAIINDDHLNARHLELSAAPEYFPLISNIHSSMLYIYKHTYEIIPDEWLLTKTSQNTTNRLFREHTASVSILHKFDLVKSSGFVVC